jgi:UDP-N-acetylglucosamine:LPS N-acetylglucosamine transferase
MGLINRLASYGARQIFTAFDEVHSRELRIGQLLSDDIAMDQDRRQFASLTGLKHSDRPCVLVMGGSQ